MKLTAAVMALIGTSQAVDCPAYGLTVATFTHVASPTCAAADDTKKATAETDLDIAEASKAFGWTTCTKTTEAAAEVAAVVDESGTETAAKIDAVDAEYSLTTCDGTAATTKFFSDDACSAAVSGKNDVVFTYVVACTAGDQDAYDYTITVNPPAAVDCPTVKATLFEYAASGDKCAADLADKTAAEAAMTWGAKACTNTVEAKAEVPAVVDGSGTETAALVPAVDGVWSTTTCTEDKVMKVSTWTDEACSAGEASTTYNYGSTDCVDSGTDFSYKLAVEEPPATPEGGEGGEGGAAGEHGVALRAASIAAIALIASQF